MSHQHHRGGRRRNYKDRDDYEDRRAIETPDDRLKAAIVSYGEVDPYEELPRLEEQIRDHVPRNLPVLSDAFRISVTEQPYKVPFYAALIRLLHNKSPVYAEEHTIGRLILEEFWRGFQSYLDKVAWRETRLCIQLFAHLTVAQVISAESMCTLLRSFIAVLDEFGVSHGRAKKAALCAGDGLIIAGSVLKDYSPTIIDEIINAIQTYNETMVLQKWLVCPVVVFSSMDAPKENCVELLDALLSVLISLKESDFEGTQNCVPQPYKGFPPLESVVQYDLPLVLVPPEVIEMESLSADAGDDTPVKKEDWPEFFFRVFPDDVSPSYHTPPGYVTRMTLLDTLEIFEVNRKESARLLLEFPKWTLPGTFKPKPGVTTTTEPVPTKDWQLESTVIETGLGAYFLLPESSTKSIYYITLIVELCKLSPSTVGPAVGKSIRKLYNGLSDGLDVEVARKFAEWFAVHMSNFGFQWVWKEWIPDLSLTVQHPKRAFMRRAVEFEIRLAYHDRVFKTLPESMQANNAYVIADQAPGPSYEYEDPTIQYHDAAQAVLNLLRGRARVEDVIIHLESLKTTLESSEEGVNVDSLIRSIVVHSLLHIGSRSFSHFLNAVERYLLLLRNLSNGSISSSSGGASPDARADILSNAASFWRYNRQMVGIVFDKFMQYQIVDPPDVATWAFMNGIEVAQFAEQGGPMNLSAFEWDVLRAALDKANGRVLLARKKVVALRKEDDDARAKIKARDENMEVDVDPKEPESVTDNPALTTSLKAYASLTKEQKSVLSRTLDGFISCLAPAPGSPHANPHTRTVIDGESWSNRASWGRDEWNAWETWGWYRHFCRLYSPYLRTYAQTLDALSFSKFNGSDDPAAAVLKMIWNTATGQDA